LSAFPDYGISNYTKPFLFRRKSMNTKKFEKLMDLVINEDNERAQELFHEIVVEKSREIFESIMAEEMEDDLDEGMGGQVGDLLDEINGEEAEEGMYEEDESDIDFDDEAEEDGDDLTHDMEMDHDEEGGEEVEDAVIRIEDKLDQLMAEFEDIMGGGADAGDDMDFGDEEDMGGDEMEFGAEEDEEAMMEAVQLKKVSVTHGDNGVQTKSPNTNNSGQAGMDSHPVKFSGDAEAVPTAPKAPSNFYSKGETSVKGAGNFKNAPGKDNFKDNGEAAPKPSHGDNGANAKSPVAESRRPARRPAR
jgi:hypothetical protein